MQTACCFGIRQNKIAGVAVHRVAGQFAVDRRAPLSGVAVTFENVEAAPFGDDDPVAIAIERAARLGRVIIFCQGTLAGKTGKDAKRAYTFRHTASDRHIAFAEHQHLSPLDHPRVACGTGGSDRIMRPRNAPCSASLRLPGCWQRCVGCGDATRLWCRNQKP